MSTPAPNTTTPSLPSRGSQILGRGARLLPCEHDFGDNLRKGAALNAIQIAEVMLARQEARAAA